MNPDVLDGVLSFALSITLKASILLGVAAIILAVTYRRTSAAMRHLVWTLAIASVLLLPVASLALPAWTVTTGAGRPSVRQPVGAVREPPAVGPVGAVREPPLRETGPAAAAPVARPRGSSGWWLALAGMYAAGVLVLMVRFGLDRRSLQRL